MGLIQRAVEEAGIPTVGITIARRFTERVKPPRSVYLKWPFGHPLGEPFNVGQQRAVLLETLRALCSIREPGEIANLPFRWRKQYAYYKTALTQHSLFNPRLGTTACG